MSQAIGCIGVVILSVEAVVLVLLDIPKILQDCHFAYKNIKGTQLKRKKSKKDKKEGKKKGKKTDRRRSSALSNDSGDNYIIRAEPFDILLQDVD